MIRSLIFLLFIFSIKATAQSQFNDDSIVVAIRPAYNNVSPRHKKLFGENYRKEWAAPTKLPVIRISKTKGGLRPVKIGGGNQSLSLRLIDTAGNEWVLRTVEKFAKGLAPKILHGSMYEEWVDDNFSAQHPFSALIVPVLAEAVEVPHSDPVIGYVADDKALGEFERDFAGMICLLERREPFGTSENTAEMLSNLSSNSNNTVDTRTFFRARLLDLLIADWGRHEDQWRWVPVSNGESKNYMVVPRDRDQALYVNEGTLPKKVSGTSLLSFLEGFSPEIENVNAFYINGRRLNQQFLNQYTYEDWMEATRQFVSALPDEILLKAVNKLPGSALHLRKDKIFQTLKSRRDNLTMAMDKYYRFLYSTVDIRTSDSAELIQFVETDKSNLSLQIKQLHSANNASSLLYQNVFEPAITKEIRLFTGKGDDVIQINAPSSTIKMRIVGGEGKKNYQVADSKSKVDVYENRDNDYFIDSNKRFNKHLSNDTLNVKKSFTDKYSDKSGFSPTGNLRAIDGLFLGVAYKHKQAGFRKDPYASLQKFSVVKSLGTKAIIFQYKGEWKSVFKNTDLAVAAVADVKGNILNYFGRGNNTFFDQTGDFRKFYRVIYSYYQFDPSLNIKMKDHFNIMFGPSMQHFSFNAKDNSGRYINSSTISSSDPTLTQDKTHAGLVLNLSWDTRNDSKLPAKGIHFNVLMQGYEGVNKYAGTYAQIFPQFSFYKSLDSKGRIVLANRSGAGFTFGETAFYQSAFLGSQDNLLGYRKFRFAGDYLAYNNFETRISLPNVFHRTLPGSLGVLGFYDAGRVWVKNEDSNTIHHGYGGGIFVAPFNRILVRAVAGFSAEGLQATVAVRQRF
jgi:hypothetical protein